MPGQNATTDESTHDTVLTRMSYTRADIHPHDFTADDVILVDGYRRDVADVWLDGDADLAISVIDGGSDWAKRIRLCLNGENQYVVVRYWVEQDNGESVSYGLWAYRRSELVTVQIAAGPIPYPDVTAH